MTVDITFKIQRMGEDAPDVPIKIRLLQPNAYLPDASVPRYDYETVTDSLGEATITVDTPGTGFSWPFSCSVDNKDTCSFPLGDDNGPTITWRYIQENLCGLDPIPPSPPIYIPVITPATTGNLVQQTADGALEDLAIAGADVETTTGSQAKADAAEAAAIADAVTKYYNQTAFSAAPTASEPLKAGGSGDITLEGLTVRFAGNTTASVETTGGNTYSRITLGTNNSATAAMMLAYGSAHPSTPNQLHFRHNYGDILFRPGGGGSVSDAMQLSVSRLSLGQQATVGYEICGKLKSSTTIDTQAARIAWAWGVSTHATRTTVTKFYNSDYGGEREVIATGANGTEATLGFYATTPTTQQVLATGAGASVDDVITALQNLGLVKQS